ncbi:MAG: VWA domain-containing protein [Acidobacteria bacterium]|nr:VWA domain-containing protein [Acidobacteriota bacterium]
MKLLPTTVAALLLAALPAAGQETPAPEMFSEVIDVRVVNVEAVVTDRDGNRIQGLDAADFALLVDGEPVPINHFTEVDAGIARADAEGDAGDGGASALPSLAAGEPVPTSYLVFIDEYFAIRRDRDRVLKALERDLERLGAHDRVALVAFDGQNVSQLTDWTASRGALRDAFDEARKRDALGIMRIVDIEPAVVEPALADRPSPALVRSRAGIRRAVSTLHLNKREREIQRSVLAATATLRSHADPPGRKVMLVLTDGWGAPRWNRDNFDSVDWRPPSIESIYGPLVHAANLVGYTLYPVDLPGLDPAFTNAPSGTSDPSATYTPSPSLGLEPNLSVLPTDLCTEWSQEASLGYLARETGGLPMINAFRDVALAEATADTRSYYWLGFEPPRNEDDTLHDIEVQLVGRPDLRVRSRRSYLDLSKSTEVTMMVEGSLLFGGVAGKETLTVEFGAPQPARGRKILLPMKVFIPLDDITLLPMGDLWMNEVELRVTVINESGDRSETPVETVRISGPAEPEPGQHWWYTTELVLRKREHRIVVAVHDPVSGTILSANETVGPR